MCLKIRFASLKYKKLLFGIARTNSLNSIPLSEVFERSEWSSRSERNEQSEKTLSRSSSILSPPNNHCSVYLKFLHICQSNVNVISRFSPAQNNPAA